MKLDMPKISIIKLTLLLSFLFIIPHISAQTLTGTVTDLISNTRVKNPQIEIINNSNQTRDTVTANSIGNWQYNILTEIGEDNFYTKFILRCTKLS